MSPEPVSSGVVHIILQYIAPPSQLTLPLPPHLLSKTVLQRHHFLDITPDDPLNYLCWPSTNDRERVVELLEDIPRPMYDDGPLAYPVRYTSDEERTCAHVDLSSGCGTGVRLVLEWDDSDGWKYHDAALMPFPQGSRDTPQAPETGLEHSNVFGRVQDEEPDSYSEGSDDDDYWNAYSAQDDSAMPDDDDRALQTKDGETGTEDAYWARYASIHGTADSTRPSPPPQPKRRLPSMPYADESNSPAPLPVPIRSESYDFQYDALPTQFAIPRPDLHSKWDPASPRELARRLTAVSLRSSPPSAQSPLPTSADIDTDSDITSPMIGGSSGSGEILETPATDCDVPAQLNAEDAKIITVVGAGLEASQTDMMEMAVRDGLKGLWNLWKMGRGTRTSTDDDKERFLEIVRGTAARNVTLEERVEELERELSVWKAALKKSDEEKRALSKSILKLERSIGSLRDDSPLVLCLIDGDGNIFSPELLVMGQAGGRQAASLITKGLNDYLSSIDSPEVALSGRGQIWLTIYCNKTGLLEVLTQNNVCTAEQFEAFVLGFNQSSPLFSIVDVGNGKEAADTKLKECLRVFTRFPQTWKVFFGGTHDNGYTSTLASLQNEGLIDKIILLRGYTKLAYEIKGLELPDMEIEGLFLKKKLYSNNNKKPSNPNTPYHKQHIEHEVSRSNAPTPSSRSQASASPPRKTKVLDLTLVWCMNVTDVVHILILCNHSLSTNVSTNELYCNLEAQSLQDSDDFEAMCERNREKNKAVLAAMGLDGPMLPPLKKSVPKPRAQRKRRAPSSEGATESDETEPPQKAARVEGGADSKSGLESTGLRRSGRNAGRKVDYTAENIKGSVPRLASVTAGLKEMDTELRSVTKRVHDPKTFGAIPGIVVGTWWLTREECSIDAIHAPWVAGIAGGPHGAYSVALSGGYEDDLDYGEAFTYTGAGGRDLKGTKSAPKNVRSREILRS
ncbi:hypothetical protein WOLCODRAFT_61159 [Wolfiporia cocos MD-104 SS10]|uniref:YDG domain-containing protein n=1 Tax=Wolfiporia cocos (strain MD-104) TaxID=742152 RepID=A0A2H3IUG6_WOLCO|nr:hypothetical protein WOLCODRAFT_61159 [Wolfiporia cocos MD-104 SS10]